jgi:hypothetical protein
MPQSTYIVKPSVLVGASLPGVATAGVSTSDAVTGVSTGISHPVSPGTYLLQASGAYTAAAGTTGIQFALVRGAGATLSAAELAVMAGVSTSSIEYTVTNSTTDGFTGGANSGGATPRPMHVNAVFVVSAAGTITLQVRSEVGGSAVTISRMGSTCTRIA